MKRVFFVLPSYPKSLFDLISNVCLTILKIPTIPLYISRYLSHQKTIPLGSGCGSVDRAVVSNTTGNFYIDHLIIAKSGFEKMDIKKTRPGMTPLKKIPFRLVQTSCWSLQTRSRLDCRRSNLQPSIAGCSIFAV